MFIRNDLSCSSSIRARWRPTIEQTISSRFKTTQLCPVISHEFCVGLHFIFPLRYGYLAIWFPLIRTHEHINKWQTNAIYYSIEMSVRIRPLDSRTMYMQTEKVRLLLLHIRTYMVQHAKFTYTQCQQRSKYNKNVPVNLYFSKIYVRSSFSTDFPW